MKDDIKIDALFYHPLLGRIKFIGMHTDDELLFDLVYFSDEGNWVNRGQRIKISEHLYYKELNDKILVPM